MYQKAEKMTPSRPVATKATRQFQVIASQIARGGAIRAPSDVPALNQPIATERSLAGNQRVATLTPVGIAADSLTPSSPRKSDNCCQLPAVACNVAAIPQTRAKMQ
jgi:hypothetical protein